MSVAAPAFTALAYALRRRGITVLTFHRVLHDKDPLRPSEPDGPEFERQMRWLAQAFDVIPLQQAADALVEGRVPSRAACITFDDGYADNLTVAAPILERLGLPATIFVVSGVLTEGAMWNDRIIEAVRAAKGRTLDLASLALGRHPIGTTQERAAAIGELLRRCKARMPEERNRIVEALEAETGVRTMRDMLTAVEVGELARRGFEIGAHTCTHPILASVDPARARAEIVESKRLLEAVVGAPGARLRVPERPPGTRLRSGARGDGARGGLHGRRVDGAGRIVGCGRALRDAPLRTLGLDACAVLLESRAEPRPAAGVSAWRVARDGLTTANERAGLAMNGCARTAVRGRLTSLVAALMVVAGHAVAQPSAVHPALASIVAGLPAGSWAHVNTTPLSSVWTPPELRPLALGNNPPPSKVLQPWSSVGYDSRRGDILSYGGGHANYAGNDTYRWRSSTLTWERMSYPSDVQYAPTNSFLTMASTVPTTRRRPRTRTTTTSSCRFPTACSCGAAPRSTPAAASTSPMHPPRAAIASRVRTSSTRRRRIRTRSAAPPDRTSSAWRRIRRSSAARCGRTATCRRISGRSSTRCS
jgi:peptidoglycan/xylan/chitin deacetylase (PgdA/CDA1 family)